MSHEIGMRLIRSLLRDPIRFEEAGDNVKLLDEYYDGLAIGTLRPLLESKDPTIRREAAFIASELGSDAWSVMDAVIPLMASDDTLTVAYAVDAVTSCGPSGFDQVLRCLEHPEAGVRWTAMDGLERAPQETLRLAHRALVDESDLHRREMLEVLLDPREAQVAAMLVSEDALARRYAAVAAGRMRDTHPQLWLQVKRSTDPDLVTYTADPAAVVTLDGLPSVAVDELIARMPELLPPGSLAATRDDLRREKVNVIVPNQAWRIPVQVFRDGASATAWVRVEIDPLAVSVETIEPDDAGDDSDV